MLKKTEEFLRNNYNISENTFEVYRQAIDDSATIKRFFKEENHIRLQPENDTMDPIIVDDCSILGKLVGIFRAY